MSPEVSPLADRVRHNKFVTRDELASFFRDSFGSESDCFAVAPGRINLIGEHTDYNDGFVFPAAIDLQLYVAAAITDGETELISKELGPAKKFNANSTMPGDIEDWGKYAAGVAWVLREHGRLKNVRAVVHSDVPIGSGVSSSAALELAFGVLFNQVSALNIGNKDLALAGQKAENDYVGVKCGIMDQMASAIGKQDQAMFLDTRSLEITYASIPDDLLIAVLDTKTPRNLTDSAYNERRSQCEKASEIMGVRALRDATLEDLEIAKPKMDETTYRRAHHVISENGRTRSMVDALQSGNHLRIGALMRASHESLRDDYQVSSRELDLMAEAAWHARGCIGARMTGAGFGGACIALVEKTLFDSFQKEVNSAYERASGLSGEITACRAVDGAHPWSP